MRQFEAVVDTVLRLLMLATVMLFMWLLWSSIELAFECCPQIRESNQRATEERSGPPYRNQQGTMMQCQNCHWEKIKMGEINLHLLSIDSLMDTHQ